MSYFAKLDENNVVTEVIEADQAFVDSQGGSWQKTSMDGSVTKNYAGVGSKYDAGMNLFISPKPYASWILNADNGQWSAPVAYPDLVNGFDPGYKWDEDGQSWKLGA